MSDIYHAVLHDGDYLCIMTAEYIPVRIKREDYVNFNNIRPYNIEDTEYSNMINTEKDNTYITHDILAISQSEDDIKRIMTDSIATATRREEILCCKYLTYYSDRQIFDTNVWDNDNDAICKNMQWQILKYSATTNTLMPVLS